MATGCNSSRGLNLSNLGSADFITRELALKNEGVERSNEERNMIFHSILISFFILFLACLIIFLNFNFVNSNLFIKYILIMSFVSAIGIVSGNVLVAERQVQNYSLVLIITGITHFLGVLLVYFFQFKVFELGNLDRINSSNSWRVFFENKHTKNYRI